MSNTGEKRKKRADDGDRNGPSGRGRFSKAQRGRHGGRGGRGGGHGPSARSARLPKASVSGPGIFLSCTRQKERKAAFELIDILEEIADRIYPGVELEDDVLPGKSTSKLDGDDDDDFDAMRNGAATLTSVDHSRGVDASTSSSAASVSNTIQARTNIEDQIADELAELQGGCVVASGHQRHNNNTSQEAHGRRKRPFSPAFTDMECCVFIAVAKPIDPVVMTYALLEEVKQTGLARSHHIHRLTPVYDTTRAELDDVCVLAERLFKEKLEPRGEPQTYKIETRIRMHGQVDRLHMVRSVASRLSALTRARDAGNDGEEQIDGAPNLSRFRADLYKPDIIVHIEIYKTVAGIGFLHNIESYGKLNPLVLAQSVQEERGTGATKNDDGPEKSIAS